jgi:hypothetical protein
MRGDTKVSKRETITRMVEIYQQEHARIKRAYENLCSAEKKLESVFGEEYADFKKFPDNSSASMREAGVVLRKLKCKAWRAIVNRLQVRKLMSVKRWTELDKKLDDHKKMPKITIQAVADLMATYEQNAMTFIEEAIREVYDDLRPHDGYRGSQYKTNQKNAKYLIGGKIILPNKVHIRHVGDDETSFTVDYDDEQLLISLDWVFAHLAGFKIADGYKSPLVDGINTAPGGVVETDFFKAKCYINGNLHLEFKRLDLLTKFNAVAGGANIMPANKENI